MNETFGEGYFVLESVPAPTAIDPATVRAPVATTTGVWRGVPNTARERLALEGPMPVPDSLAYVIAHERAVSGLSRTAAMASVHEAMGLPPRGPRSPRWSPRGPGKEKAGGLWLPAVSVFCNPLTGLVFSQKWGDPNGN
jgi:hypothetical protein